MYNLGDGSDVISAKRNKGVGVYEDILRFGKGIMLEDLHSEKQGNHLRIQVGNGVNDTILIENFYATARDDRTKIIKVEFADGSVINHGDKELNPVIYGDELANLLNGTDFAEKLFGFAGDDVINPGAGDDYIEAGDGDDTVNMGNGKRIS